MPIDSINADEKEIRRLDADWGQAASAGRIDDVVAFYAPNGSVVWPGAPAAHNTKNIRAAWRKIFSSPKYKGLKLKFTPKRIDISHDGKMAADFGKVAFGYGTGARRVNKEGKYIVVWIKIDGVWKVLYDCYNLN